MGDQKTNPSKSSMQARAHFVLGLLTLIAVAALALGVYQRWQLEQLHLKLHVQETSLQQFEVIRTRLAALDHEISVLRTQARKQPDYPIDQMELLMLINQANYTINEQHHYSYGRFLLKQIEQRLTTLHSLDQSKMHDQLERLMLQLDHVINQYQLHQKVLSQLQQVSRQVEQLLHTSAIQFQSIAYKSTEPEFPIGLSKTWQENWDNLQSKWSKGMIWESSVKPYITQRSVMEQDLFVWQVEYQVNIALWALLKQQPDLYHETIQQLRHWLQGQVEPDKRLDDIDATLALLGQTSFESMNVDVLSLVTVMKGEDPLVWKQNQDVDQ